MFQSQARSQSPGDDYPFRCVAQVPRSFNLRREANPLATESADEFSYCNSRVSISGEKPIPWRRKSRLLIISVCPKFQSQARSQSPGDNGIDTPVVDTAKFQSQARSQSPGDLEPLPRIIVFVVFQSQARSQSPGDCFQSTITGADATFQSQARSQSPGDSHICLRSLTLHQCFNLRREANPLATNAA